MLQFVSIVTAAESRVIIRSTALLSRSLITPHTATTLPLQSTHSAHFARNVKKLRLLRSTYNTPLSLLSLQLPTTVIGCSATTATWMAMLFGLCPVWLFLYYVDCGAEADPAFRFCYCYRCSDATNERVRIGDGTEQHSTLYSPAPGLKNIGSTASQRAFVLACSTRAFRLFAEGRFRKGYHSHRLPADPRGFHRHRPFPRLLK